MKMDCRLRVGRAVSAVVVLVAATVASAQQVPNADFTEGTDRPTGWTLSGGEGRWVDHSVLEVTGTGQDANAWKCDVEFAPKALYRFRMKARRVNGSGSATCGTSFANHDFGGIGETWRWYGFVCRGPDKPASHNLHIGQWHSQGQLQFDAVRLTTVLPIHTQAGDLLLGDGESIYDGCYEFVGSFDREGTNYHRTLASSNAWFNTNRWCLGDGSQVTYRFELPGHRFLSGEAAFLVNYHTGGTCVAEASRDGNTWQTLASRESVGEGQAALPAELFPADVIFLRMRGAGKGANFQVNRVSFKAPLSDPPGNASGKTVFADQEETSPQVRIEQLVLTDADLSDGGGVRLSVRNALKEAVPVTLDASIEASEGGTKALPAQTAKLAAGESATLSVALLSGKPGERRLVLKVQPAGGQAARVSFAYEVPGYYRTDYGQLLPTAGDGPRVWWCDATHKIPRQRAAPDEPGQAAELSAARNDREAVQIVVRPDKTLRALRAACSPLTQVGGTGTIAAKNVKVLRVYYHFVEHPTDRTGVRDWWPDALPPLEKPIDVEAGNNQPLWVLVHVPTDAMPGDYAGELALEADGWAAKVPLRLHVWDFALPERNHLQTAFGFNPGMAFSYHQVKTEADKRKLMDLYFQSFAEHRISPYNPVPLDGFQVKFVPDANPARAEIDFSGFDKAMAQAVKRYHFTGYRLPIAGMGGGTFHSRSEPSIGTLGEESPQYQAMFSSQVKQIEEHLRQKGWLDMAYVYWFDEPDPKDYAFVRGGMERIKRYAPGIQTMLTEQPEEALAGPVDIWCPVTPQYNEESAKKFRERGNRFWWYVCTGPKAPFCTLFIDHAATELRVWHWQTWQRDIVGTLVWETNYWTSSAAFPDKPQNPYEDPMGYVSGYSTPRGTKRYWGNGDGRFIYPPLEAAVPGASGPDPVLKAPVSSIRWEMLREGVEDYEYLYLLRALLENRRGALSAEQAKRCEALLEVPSSITVDMTTFATDPAPIYARRAAVATAIEELQRAGHPSVPGVAIDYSPASSGKYIGSPSIAILPNGDYVASHDLFGPRADADRNAITRVFGSSDRGKTWKHLSDLEHQFWSTLFVHRGALYLIGASGRYGNAVIRRSDDGGKTWTEPKDATSGVLLAGPVHCAPGPVIEHNGRLWRGMEDSTNVRRWGLPYRAFMMSAPVDADLLRADSWTSTNRVASDAAWLDGKFNGWLEGAAVATPDGKIVDVLRVDCPEGGMGAIVKISDEGRTATFDPASGFIEMPGGAKKFTIRYDPQSKEYWSLVNYIPPKFRGLGAGGVRNTLALVNSPDLRHWTVRCVLLHHPEVPHHGFQYPDWQFDGEDMIAAVRTGYDDGLGGAHNAHDANYLTFHRIKDFRKLTLGDSVIDVKQLGMKP